MSLDGSSLIDIGSNSGVIVTLNNDMVQEVKVQSSNFAAEYGTGGMNVSGVTKSGSSTVPRRGSTTTGATTQFAANDRSNSIAGTPKPKSKYQYPGGNIGGPIIVRRQLHEEPRQAVLLRRASKCSGSRSTRARASTRTYTQAMRNGDFSELLRQPRLEPEQHSAAAHSAGIPERRPAGAEQRHAAVHARRSGKYLASLYPLPNYNDPNNLYNYVYSRARADEPHRLQDAVRLEHQQQHEGVRPRRARSRDAENPRGVWWGPSDVRCRRRTSATTRAGRSPATSSRC